MTSVFRVCSRMFSTARAIVLGKTALKNRIYIKPTCIGFAVCLPAMSMMYILGMHQSLRDLELSEEEKQVLKERAKKSLAKELGLTPEQSTYYFRDLSKQV